MITNRENPAARADAGRASGLFVFATKHPEDKPAHRNLQAAFLNRRFGLTPQRAAILASLIFGEGPR
jgi:hypothetical protein